LGYVGIKKKCIDCPDSFPKGKKYFNGLRCWSCYRKKNNPSPPSPPLSSSSSSSSSQENQELDLDLIFSPLNPFIVDEKKKKRDNYNNYHQYENEFFSVLFRNFINNIISPITLKTASEYFKINYSTLKSKYQLWKENELGISLIGTMDRRGGKRKLSDDDESLIKTQLFKRMDENEKTQNGHLVDFIMNLHPNFYPSIGFLARLKKKYRVSSRFTHIEKKRKELTKEEREDENDALIRYYENVENAVMKYGAEGVYNYDEKPLSTAPKRISSFHHQGKKKKKLSSNGDPDRVYTAGCTVAANGDKLPLTIIKMGVKMESASSQLVKQSVSLFDNYMGLTRKGWVNGSSMNHWIRNVFAVNARLPCALIMDGYGAHWTPEVMATAAELRIELIDMPPNHTNEIQPLDVGVFGALQSMTDRDWETDDSVTDYLNNFQQAWEDFSSDNIRKAFYNALALEEGILEDEEANNNAREALGAIDSIDNAVKMFINAIPSL
jgi:hypothetical protein